MFILNTEVIQLYESVFSLSFLHLSSSKYQSLVSWVTTTFLSLIHETQKCYLLHESPDVFFFKVLY